jgi:hypothetical protein
MERSEIRDFYRKRIESTRIALRSIRATELRHVGRGPHPEERPFGRVSKDGHPCGRLRQFVQFFLDAILILGIQIPKIIYDRLLVVGNRIAGQADDTLHVVWPSELHELAFII